MWLSNVAVLIVVTAVSSIFNHMHSGSSDATKRLSATSLNPCPVSPDHGSGKHRRDAVLAVPTRRNIVTVYCAPCPGTKEFQGAFSPKHTINYIKDTLRGKLALGDSEVYQLSLNGEELDDQKTIEEVGIRENDRLEILAAGYNRSGLVGGNMTLSSISELPLPSRTFKAALWDNTSIALGAPTPGPPTLPPSPTDSTPKIYLKISSPYSGEAFEGAFLPDDTVLSVKHRFGFENASEAIQLIYKGVELSDGHSLEQEGVEDGAWIMLMNGHGKSPSATLTATATNLVPTSQYMNSSRTNATTTPDPVITTPNATYLQTQPKDIMVTFRTASFVWIGHFSPSDTILSLKKALDSGTGMMWNYLTLLHGSQALIDNQATLSDIGFTIGDSVDLEVIFATSTVTKLVLVTATIQPGGPRHMYIPTAEPLTSITPTTSSIFTGSVQAPMEGWDLRSSTRLPLTWAG